MKKISNYFTKWQSLSWYSKIGFVNAMIILVIIKIGLTILPFSTFRRFFYFICKTDTYVDISVTKINEIVWAVDTAANILPLKLLCLPRALATKFLLRKVPSLSLEIGIEINPEKAFEAHAWVEKGGEIIIGDWSESVSYQRLWIWE